MCPVTWAVQYPYQYREYGKPAHEGDSPSKGGLSPSWGGGGGSFHVASRLQENEPKLQKATMSMMSMKVHVSFIHAPIY